MTSRLLPKFVGSPIAIVFMSEHVHGYERFEIGGKTYVVTGGGGGPRVEYSIGSDAHPAPAYQPGTGDPRAFNYVVIQLEDSKLVITAKCIDATSDAPPTPASPKAAASPSNGATPRKPVCNEGVLERFTVAFPRRAPSAPASERAEGL